MRQEVYAKCCTGCGEEKSLDAFRRGQGYKNGVRAECKTCEATRLRRWRETHPDKHRDQWTRKNARLRAEGRGAYDPDPTKRQIRSMQARDAYLRRTYGVTLDEYVGMVEAQGGCCAVCLQPPTKVAGVSAEPMLVVDHCHDSGRVRGLLCTTCNTGIGHLADNPDRVLAAYHYLSDTLVVDR